MKDDNIKRLIVKASEWKDSPEDFISTGILPLDIALVRGGYRRGRLVEIFGKEHTGKTLTTMLALIWDQKINKRKSLFVDAEGSFNVAWFEQMGGNLDLLDVYDPYQGTEIYGEIVYDNVIKLIETGEYAFTVLDSLMGSALLSNEILDKTIDSTKRMGIDAKLNKQFFRRAFIVTSQTSTTLLITNHVVDNIGVMFGSKETTPGGSDLKFRAEQRLRISSPKEKNEFGHRSEIKIIKNKRGASAGKKIDFMFNYNYGVDNFEEMAKLMVKKGLIPKKDKKSYYNSINGNYEEYEKNRLMLLDLNEKDLLQATEEYEDEIVSTNYEADDFQE